MADTITGTDASLDELKSVIRTCPVIDNHAHNLLRSHAVKSEDFLAITSEATGDALRDATRSLPHLRAAKQLRTLYGLPQEADWSAIVQKRADILRQDGETLTKKCFEGTQTILIDDGLGKPEDIERYSYQDRFTLSPCKRIVRIETVAADILASLHQKGQLPTGVDAADEEACALAWVSFVTSFEQSIAAALRDEEVVGFKSVVCYRTGLDVRVGRDIEVTEHGLRSFRKHFLPECTSKNFRVEHKGVNDALVVSTCKLIAAAHKDGSKAKPLQFHTGLGDNDISLLDSNPALLQPLIKAFPTVPFVLLHSSYPYTREAGYLACTYKNAYLDIGEVFPMVSRDGQEKIVRQALELTPATKILWSTDGHHYAETYYLANLQGREAIERVLVEYVQQGDLTADLAIQTAKEIFFLNSNTLYDLGLQLHMPGTSEPTKAAPSNLSNTNAHLQGNTRDLGITATPPPDPALSGILEQYAKFKYVVVQWLDYFGQIRARAYPIYEFQRMCQVGEPFSISYGNLGTLQDDTMTAVCSPIGSVFVTPEPTTLRPFWGGGAMKNAATVMAGFMDDAGKPHPECPRSKLQQLVEAWRGEHQIDLLVGFEIEVAFCRRSDKDPESPYEPLDTNHAWGTFSYEQILISFPHVTAMVDALQSIGIAPQAFHSESGPGQYEFVLAPLPPVLAVDTLMQARQCIQQVAAVHGFRATLHPLPFAGAGSGAHAHISINSTNLAPTEVEAISSSFLASVLDHLPAICAMTMPQEVSYGRVAANHWTGGEWVAWGPQNREIPIRQSAWNRYEVRCLDGLANTYLALFAILGAGLMGVNNQMPLKMKGCLDNPSKLSETELGELGITNKLPTSLTAALEALENDTALRQFLDGGGDESPGIIKRFLAMKPEEQKMLMAMDEKQRHIWLIERY